MQAQACLELGRRVQESLGTAGSQCFGKPRPGERSGAAAAGGGTGAPGSGHTTLGSHKAVNN